MTTQVILDTDLAMGAPGSDIDDGFALALAVADPSIQINAITTVNGNTDVCTATELAVKLLEKLTASDIPVFRGADRPLLREPNHVLREQGECVLSDATAASSAAVKIVEIARRSKGKLVILAIGPLTNLALALRLDPGIVDCISEIVVMGGVFSESTHRANMPGEFNIWVDPESAQIVVDSGIRVRFVGLDVTLKTRLGLDEVEEMEKSEVSFVRYAGKYTREWIKYIATENPGVIEDQDSCAMHDPLAVAALSDSSVIQWRDAYVKFCCGSESFRGMAIADFLESKTTRSPNCKVAVDVDVDKFKKYFYSTLSRIS